MKRTLLVALAVVGAIGFVAAGSISARLPGSVHSLNNNAKTGKFTPPHKLEAAVVEQEASCADAAYSKGPIPAVLDALPNLDSGGGAILTKRFCIRNVGRGTGQVRFNAFSVTESELTCEAEEVDPALGNDTTCVTDSNGTVTGAGELAPHLQLSVFPDGTNPAGCGSGQLFSFSAIHAVPNSPAPWRTLAPSLAPGDVCRYSWNGQIDGTTTEQQRFAAQTDEVRWHFQFNLEDIPT